MAHFAKFERSDMKNMTLHYERGKGADGKPVRYRNEEIDQSKTHMNYNLAPIRLGGLIEFIQRRCNEVYCHNRADVNVLVSWVVTLPKGFPEEQEKDFFVQSYEFLKMRYGEENVVSAYVHRDETQPHIHFAFVPVVADSKRQYKVSAKELVNRKELKVFHDDLSNHMIKFFGRDVGILNEATKEGNRSIMELKRRSAVERLKDINEKAQNAEQTIGAMMDEAYSELMTIDEKKATAEAEIGDLESKLQSLMRHPEFARTAFARENEFKFIALQQRVAKILEMLPPDLREKAQQILSGNVQIKERNER